MSDRLSLQIHFSQIGRYRTFFVVLVLLFSFTACSRNVQKVEHAVDTTDPLNASKNHQFTDAPAMTDVESFNLENGISFLDQATELNATEVDDVLHSRVMPMAERLLKDELLSSTEIMNLQAQRVFRRFHEAILVALSDESSRAEALKFAVEYSQKFILKGCDASLDDCRYKSFFKGVSFTKEILMSPFKYSENANQDRCSTMELPEYYRRLKMAYAYTIEEDAPRVDAYYLECAIPNLTRLQSEESRLIALPDSDSQKTALSALVTEIRNVKEILGQIIRRSDRIRAVPELRASYDRFHAQADPFKYDYSVRPHLESLLALKDVRREVLLDDATQGLINEPAYLEKLVAQSAARNSDYQYTKIVSYLQDNNPNIMPAMGIAPYESTDFYLAIIEKIGSRQWDSYLATRVFEGLRNKDKERLEDVIEHFVRMMLLRQVVASNVEMGNFFAKVDFSVQETFLRVAEKAMSLQKDWIAFHDAVKVIRDFTVGALGIPYSDLVRLGIDVESLVESTNYMVVLPHMMLLAYKLYEGKFSMRLFTPFGMVNINYADVFSYFFSSGSAAAYGVTPWFDYSPGLNQAYTRYKTGSMIRALYFALRTNAFETYRIKPEDFLKGTFDTLISPYSVLAKEAVERYSKDRRLLDVDYTATKNFCAEERKRKTYGSDYAVNYRHILDFVGLEGGVLSNLEFFKKMTMTIRGTQNVYLHNPLVGYDHEGFALHAIFKQEIVDHFRLGGSYWDRYLGAIGDIYRQYKIDSLRIETGGEAPTESQLQEIDSKLGNINFAYRAYKQDLRRFYTIYNQGLKEVALDCVILGSQRELDIYHKVYLAEIEYLRGVYRQWKQSLDAVTPSEQESAIAAINDGLREDVQIPQYNYQGRTAIRDGMFHYAKLDVYLRIKTYLKRIAPELTITMPDTAEKFFALKWYKETDLSAEIPIIWRDNRTVTEDEFVKMAMSFWGRRPSASWGDQYVKWASEFSVQWGGMYVIRNWLPAMSVYYMTGEVEMFAPDAPKYCLSTSRPPDDKECPVVKDYLVSADELIQENLALDELVSVREDQEAIYDMLNIGMLHDDTFIYSLGFDTAVYDQRTVDVIVEPTEYTELGLLDGSYVLLSLSEFLGLRPDRPWEPPKRQDPNDRYDPNRIHPFDSLKSYKHSRDRFDYLLFKVDPATTAQIDQYFLDYYSRFDGLIQGFESAALETKADDEARIAAGETWIGIDGRTYPWSRSVRINLRKDRVYGEYLTQKYKDEYRLRRRDFNLSTEYFFVPEQDPRRVSGE